MITGRHLLEGLRIFRHAVKRRLVGPRRYTGNATQVCQQVVEQCWNGSHYMTSRGNYPEFYSRDFGMCVDALLFLKQKERVRQTLEYALATYRNHGRFCLVISPSGVPFDFPNVYAPDGFAFLLHSLVSLNDRKLLTEYRAFLNQELRRFYMEVVDPITGLPLRQKHFSGMRDYAVRDAACYDAVMVAAVQKYAKALKLENPLTRWKYGPLLLKEYWNGRFFEDDLQRTGEMTGDANTLPFWFGVLPKGKEKQLFAKVLAQLRKRELDSPLPLRYEPHTNESRKMIWLDRLAGGWEQDTVWLHLGNLFMHVLLKQRKKLAVDYFDQYTQLIEKERCYPEVLTKEGRIFSSPLFHSDCSMLWAANYLLLKGKLRQ